MLKEEKSPRKKVKCVKCGHEQKLFWWKNRKSWRCDVCQKLQKVRK